jgi:hypothetical protein
MSLSKELKSRLKSIAPLNREIYELKHRLEEVEAQRDALKETSAHHTSNEAATSHSQPLNHHHHLIIRKAGTRRPASIYWGISCFDCSEVEPEHIIFPLTDDSHADPTGSWPRP